MKNKPKRRRRASKAEKNQLTYTSASANDLSEFAGDLLFMKLGCALQGVPIHYAPDVEKMLEKAIDIS
jgi:hypothetical protein